MSQLHLGINVCFAVKRWPEPDQWVRIVKNELGLDSCQFSFDLLDPLLDETAVMAYADEVRACAHLVRVSHHGGLVEQRIEQVKAELTGVEAKLVFDDTYPLVRLRPAFDREADVDSQVQLRHCALLRLRQTYMFNILARLRREKGLYIFCFGEKIAERFFRRNRKYMFKA